MGRGDFRIAWHHCGSYSLLSAKFMVRIGGKVKQKDVTIHSWPEKATPLTLLTKVVITEISDFKEKPHTVWGPQEECFEGLSGIGMPLTQPRIENCKFIGKTLL